MTGHHISKASRPIGLLFNTKTKKKQSFIITEVFLMYMWNIAGLTCTEQNFVTKAGSQKYAAEHGVAIVAPDTSPSQSS